MESELVSGFMTEHAAVIFVFFFLAEYGSILLMCILISILFLGGYLMLDILNVLNSIYIYLFHSPEIVNYLGNSYDYTLLEKYSCQDSSWQESIVNSLLHSLILGLKTSIMVFTFIWVRASFPRIRFDQLMTFCWTVMLPILFAYILLIPCILFDFNAVLININLF